MSAYAYALAVVQAIDAGRLHVRRGGQLAMSLDVAVRWLLLNE